MKTYNNNSTEARVLNTINNGTHEENALCIAAGMRNEYPEFCRALWQLQRDGVITYMSGEYYITDPETLEHEAATADRMERERKEAKSQTPAERKAAANTYKIVTTADGRENAHEYKSRETALTVWENIRALYIRSGYEIADAAGEDIEGGMCELWTKDGRSPRNIEIYPANA